ncbi:MAG: U32 family peptidase [Lachnospiraceae bacterium]|nr:U32 family peptidase [Lachnospiraceae bacterium]
MNRPDIKLPELLAPAGSAEGLRAAIRAGADAVYIGAKKFGARAYADNPDTETMLRAIDYAHLRGARVYLTVNTLLKNEEIGELRDFLLPYYRRGVDAVLVQDFGVLKTLRELFPDLPLHASTQMTITDPHAAGILKEFGITRIVPAREMSLSELTAIKEKSGLEVEVFIHGALCYCYSGQCLYSSLLGGRSGNRGRCAQPCRLLYLKNNTSFDGTTSILLEKEARHFLSPKDLNTINLLPQLVLAGMDSLKIEGRMKQPEYAAGVVSIYRRNLDRIGELLAAGDRELKGYRVSADDHRMLYDLYMRSGFTDGYFTLRNGPEMMALVKHELTQDETKARHDLYGVMHDRYMTEELTLPADLHLTVRAGEVLSAFASDDTHSAYVTGPYVSEAKNRPLTSERILENAARTGGTDFHLRSAAVDTDGRSFVPIGSLNEIRRSALEALKEEILAEYLRDEPDLPAFPKAEAPSAEKKMALSALVRTEEQYTSILSTHIADKIYLESALIYESGEPVESAKRLIRAGVREGAEVWIALPCVTRSGRDAAALIEAGRELAGMGLAGFLIRSYGSFAAVREAGFLHQADGGTLSAHDGRAKSGDNCHLPQVRLDAGLYTWNDEAVQFFRELGVCALTAPYELNRKELFARDNAGSEMIVYGSIPLMVTANCVKMNTEGCSHRGESLTLTDRMGAVFRVKCECPFCYNLIYNSIPLSLLKELDTIRRMGFDGLRLQFTGESGKETADIARAFSDAMHGRAAALPFETTKGHFMRGVE